MNCPAHLLTCEWVQLEGPAVNRVEIGFTEPYRRDQDRMEWCEAISGIVRALTGSRWGDWARASAICASRVHITCNAHRNTINNAKNRRICMRWSRRIKSSDELCIVDRTGGSGEFRQARAPRRYQEFQLTLCHFGGGLILI